MSKSIAIYGAGGFGREVECLINHINLDEKVWDFIGYFDDMQQSIPNYLGDITALNSYSSPINIVIANGDSQTRSRMFQKISNPHIIFPTLIHPSSIIGNSDSVHIGQGTIICAGAIITTEISIGQHCIINLNATIGHNSTLEDFVSLMPGVNIAGDCQLEKCSFVGSGANILNGKTIGEKAKIGSGAVVISDIPSYSTAVGVPAKIINK